MSRTVASYCLGRQCAVVRCSAPAHWLVSTKIYAPGTYVGSRAGECVLLQRRSAEAAAAATAPSRYARAFTQRREMPYFVLPETAHILWSCLWVAVAAVVQRLPLVLALLFVRFCHHDDFEHVPLYGVVLTIVSGLSVGYIATLVWVLSVDICSKWLLLGRREVGEYSWDQNSYCQSWQLYLSVLSIRHFLAGGRDVLDCFLGSWYLVAYFRSQGATIGKNVCLYPNGADPMMTEPEMVTIGDGACVDSAMLIAHLNTRGQFTLGPLEVGQGCVMRSWARLQQGGVMQRRSVLLEHTLIMPQEVVSQRNLKQGWPASYGMAMQRAVKAPVVTPPEERRPRERFISGTLTRLNPRISQSLEKLQGSLELTDRAQSRKALVESREGPGGLGFVD